MFRIMLELRALADPAVLTRTISVRARSLSLVSGLIISVWASVQQHQKKKKKKKKKRKLLWLAGGWHSPPGSCIFLKLSGTLVNWPAPNFSFFSFHPHCLSLWRLRKLCKLMWSQQAFSFSQKKYEKYWVSCYLAKLSPDFGNEVFLVGLISELDHSCCSRCHRPKQWPDNQPSVTPPMGLSGNRTVFIGAVLVWAVITESQPGKPPYRGRLDSHCVYPSISYFRMRKLKNTCWLLTHFTSLQLKICIKISYYLSYNKAECWNIQLKIHSTNQMVLLLQIDFIFLSFC